MTVKVLVDTSHILEGKRWINGSVTSVTPSTVGTRVWGDAVRSRPKPLIPSVTAYQYDYYVINPNHYEVWFVESPKSGREGPAHFVWPTLFRSVQETADEDSGLTRALAKTSKSAAGWGETLAEGKNTVNMIRNRVISLYRMGSALKRGDFKRAYDAVSLPFDPRGAKELRKMSSGERLANGYLELSLGWQPLLRDISGTAKAYANGLTTRGAKVRQHSGSYTKVPNASEVSGGLPPLVPIGGYSGVVVNPGLHDLNQLGLLNVPQILWDRVPLSFVFDWVIPIGTFLGALTGAAGLGSVRAYGVKQSRTTRFVGPSLQQLNVFHRVDYRGVRMPKSALPSLSVLLRGSADDWGKLVTLTALFRQRLS